MIIKLKEKGPFDVPFSSQLEKQVKLIFKKSVTSDYFQDIFLFYCRLIEKILKIPNNEIKNIISLTLEEAAKKYLNIENLAEDLYLNIKTIKLCHLRPLGMFFKDKYLEKRYLFKKFDFPDIELPDNIKKNLNEQINQIQLKKKKKYWIEALKILLNLFIRPENVQLLKNELVNSNSNSIKKLFDEDLKNEQEKLEKILKEKFDEDDNENIPKIEHFLPSSLKIQHYSPWMRKLHKLCGELIIDLQEDTRNLDNYYEISFNDLDYELSKSKIEIIDEKKKENNEIIQTLPTKIIVNNNGFRGLKNLGRTSYLNSTVQCLSHTKEFIDLLNQHISCNPIIQALIKTINEIFKEEKKPYIPLRLFHSIGNQFPQFNFTELSQDSFEFLQILLNFIDTQIPLRDQFFGKIINIIYCNNNSCSIEKNLQNENRLLTINLSFANDMENYLLNNLLTNYFNNTLR